MNQGKLVPEDVIFGLLSERLEEGYYRGETGFILDGIPRTRIQAVSFNSALFNLTFYVLSLVWPLCLTKRVILNGFCECPFFSFFFLVLYFSSNLEMGLKY